MNVFEEYAYGTEHLRQIEATEALMFPAGLFEQFDG